jgi:beta-hydroxyacyl-ACP dehydratase FabZ
MVVLENIDIRDILPHRYPFLLVDRIVEMESDRIVGIKNVSANEPFFAGHFPDFPVMPGVLIIEAMAQVAGILVLFGVPDRKTKLVLFASIEEAKFRKPVLPGDTLRMDMKILKKKATAVKAQGVATVDGVVVAEATVMCIVTERPSKPALPTPAP